MKYCDTDKLQLKVAGNGRGFPSDMDIEHSNTLGMQLIRLFSEQMKGDLYLINNHGLEIILNFKAGADDNVISKLTA